MKNTTLDNPEILVKDNRITTLDRIVREVKQSEEWEAARAKNVREFIGKIGQTE